MAIRYIKVWVASLMTSAHPLTQQEVLVCLLSLLCLCQVAREVCAGAKAR